MDLTLTTRDVGSLTVLAVGGEVDVYSAPSLRDSVNEQIAAGRCHLVVDLTAVKFFDSTALGVLVGALKAVQDDSGSLQVVCANPRLLKIFTITGLAKAFTIHADADAALAAPDPA